MSLQKTVYAAAGTVCRLSSSQDTVSQAHGLTRVNTNHRPVVARSLRPLPGRWREPPTARVPVKRPARVLDECRLLAVAWISALERGPRMGRPMLKPPTPVSCGLGHAIGDTLIQPSNPACRTAVLLGRVFGVGARVRPRQGAPPGAPGPARVRAHPARRAAIYNIGGRPLLATHRCGSRGPSGGA